MIVRNLSRLERCRYVFQRFLRDHLPAFEPHGNPEELYITIAEGYRTQERQTSLYEAGKSQRRRSLHQKGLAVDLYFIQYGEIVEHGALYQELYDFLLARWKQENITGQLNWGGNWRSLKDYGHFEMLTRA